ncbi:MAG: hypothetical protein JSV70_00195 [bacterium]|nr:MAG: hypothetical protein JSV70_00195 [bacterium]
MPGEKFEVVEELNDEELKDKEAKGISGKLDAVSWSLFFIWMGVVMITRAETAVAFFGIGVLILGAQAARSYFLLKIEKFWIIVGILFIAGSLWDILDLNAPFGAVVLILIGAAILVSTFRKKDREKTSERGAAEKSSP